MEKELGKSIEEVDRDFMDWFTKNSVGENKNGSSGRTQDKPCKTSANIDPREQQPVPCEPATAK